MGKGLRSKSKRASRTEFRNTIGKQFSQRTMETVQEKLQQNINKGTMNSFERLARTLQSNPTPTAEQATIHSSMDVVVDDLNQTNPTTSPSAANKQLVLNSTHTKKHSMPFTPGQSGAKLARRIISKRNRRGQVSIGVGIVKKHRLKK